jgi:hypothetical protein
MDPAGDASADWTRTFEGDFADSFCRTLRSLPWDQLQRYPPPKSGGLPLGHELRIAGRFLRGRSSMLDPSGLSRLYRRFAPDEQRLLYQGLVLGEPLDQKTWRALLSREAADEWVERRLFDAAGSERLRCRFRVIAVNGLLLVVDHSDNSIPQRVHIGQDSLNMVEFLAGRPIEPSGAMLDVGTGSGLQLLASGRDCKSALGVDINPRAVRIARLNVQLNEAHSCSVEFRDAFDPQWRPDPFRLVTWNLPFMFFPDDEVSQNLDGHGGHLGIALTLRFVERLVDLLAADGVAWLLSSAPLLFDGQNALESELAQRAERCRLDISTFVLQKFWDKRHIQFHRSHQIRCFESVMIGIRPGTGRFHRHPPGIVRRSVDGFRAQLNERRALGGPPGVAAD